MPNVNGSDHLRSTRKEEEMKYTDNTEKDE